nr:hypothetical protein Itr_chr07CG09000 [Ipomoea trifida]
MSVGFHRDLRPPSSAIDAARKAVKEEERRRIGGEKTSSEFVEEVSRGLAVAEAVTEVMEETPAKRSPVPCSHTARRRGSRSPLPLPLPLIAPITAHRQALRQGTPLPSASSNGERRRTGPHRRGAPLPPHSPPTINAAALRCPSLTSSELVRRRRQRGRAPLRAPLPS